MPAAKKPTLEDILNGINKDYGAGSIRSLKDAPLADIESFSTGSSLLDEAIGVGGLPRGRIVELYGPESSGKTTVALHAIASAQKKGYKAAFIDAEHALDPSWARTLGVDTDSLLVSQPGTGEEALEITDRLCQSGKVAIIVIDSVAALVPRAELEGDMGQAHVGLQARLMSQALRKLTGICSTSETCVVFINQLREKVGVFYGSPETTAGGKALKFYASIRIDVRRIGPVKAGSDMIGNEVRGKIVKNKMAPPFKEAIFQLLFGEGISNGGAFIDECVLAGVIDKKGAFYYFEGELVGNGQAKVRAAFKDHPELLKKIEVALAAADPSTRVVDGDEEKLLGDGPPPFAR
jgi:recombination protein RecA